MTGGPRIRCQAVAGKVMPAEDAAAFITPGDRVGMSGFTGFGHPKAVPAALVRRAADAAARGDRFAVSVWTARPPPLSWMVRWRPWTGSTCACLTSLTSPTPVTRAKINAGTLDYLAMHRSHVAQMVTEGFLGHLDTALIEVSGVTADGALIPSSVGNNNAWIDLPTGSSSR